MFTGIVTAMGTVRDIRPAVSGIELEIAGPWRRLARGESVAVDGACLTVERQGWGWFGVRVVSTTLDRTRFGGYRVGQPVNLERALRVGDRLGGHLVQGHVDGIGVVERVEPRGDARLLDIRAPGEIAEVSVPLGSITVDGVSLTVNALPDPGVVQVSLIPCTIDATTLGQRREGDAVHLEGDTIGKYVRQLLERAQS